MKRYKFAAPQPMAEAASFQPLLFTVRLADGSGEVHGRMLGADGEQVQAETFHLTADEVKLITANYTHGESLQDHFLQELANLGHLPSGGQVEDDKPKEEPG